MHAQGGLRPAVQWRACAPVVAPSCAPGAEAAVNDNSRLHPQVCFGACAVVPLTHDLLSALHGQMPAIKTSPDAPLHPPAGLVYTGVMGGIGGCAFACVFACARACVYVCKRVSVQGITRVRW